MIKPIINAIAVTCMDKIAQITRGNPIPSEEGSLKKNSI